MTLNQQPPALAEIRVPSMIANGTDAGTDTMRFPSLYEGLDGYSLMGLLMLVEDRLIPIAEVEPYLLRASTHLPSPKVKQ